MRTIVLALLLGGCASVSETYLPSGEKGYSIACASWDQCYEKAGELCGPKGYEPVTGNRTDQAIASGGTFVAGSRVSLLVRCRP